MQDPSIITTVKDVNLGVTFKVYAYRKLEPEEAIGAVNAVLMNTKRSKWPKNGSTMSIVTVIGAD